jgi:allantoinase
MSMPDAYLTYPKRAYGMDQDRYDWRLAADRRALVWPAQAAVAAMIVVPIEHHTLAPVGKPFKAPGAMVTPYPDLRHYTTRDYGNRVGVYRLLDALKALDLTATFPINANQLGRLRPLVEAILEDGHEIAAHGLSMDHIHWGGLDIAEETEWVEQVRHAFDAMGLKPRAWLSPARQQSFNTLDLIAAAGFDLCLDWEPDGVPLALRTRAGPMTALPLSNELDDRSLLIDRRQTEDDWGRQILEAAAYLTAEAPRHGGQVLGFTLTPYVSGQPFRQHAVRGVLVGLKAQEVWVATASQIADAAKT